MSYKPAIIVATPGRLWELMDERMEPFLVGGLPMIDILVLDEADRMIADGHFKELKLILNHIYSKRVEYKKEAKARNAQNKLNKKAGITAPQGKLGMDVMQEKSVLKMKDSAKTDEFKVGHNLETS